MTAVPESTMLQIKATSLCLNSCAARVNINHKAHDLTQSHRGTLGNEIGMMAMTRTTPRHSVSRQLQAVDCDVDGGIVMREIAGGLCVARGLQSLLSRNSHLEVDNRAILHSSF
jgi:hypothetical protein